MNPLITAIIGYAAAIVGTSLMLPQAIKSFKTKSVQDLSYLTLVFYFLNCVLWGLYGFLINAMPVIVCNSIALVISIFQLWLKFKYHNKEIYVDPRHHEHAFDLPFWRDNKKLWALEVPVEEMSVDELLWMLDIPFWEDEKGNIVITPNEVINDPDQYPFHRDKIKAADTSYPIDIMKNKKGNWATLDGLHRLVQLVLKKETTVRVRKIPPELIHLTARDE